MLDNLPLRTVQHGELTIEGYSRAAVQTYWRIPEWKLGFDLGGSPWSFTGTDTFFITHTHLDHMAALPVLVARRRMMKMEPPTIYLPAHAVEPTRRMLRTWHRLDRGRMACELVGVEPGQEIELSRERVVTVFPTKHTVPSVGYVVWSRRRKLKPELQGLTQDEIRDRRLAGEEVTYELREPKLCFTGDTSPEGWDACDAVYTATVLITELTFFRPDHRRSKIHKFGHTHLDDFLERADRFANELIILTHFSTRYSDQHIQKVLTKRMPEHLRERVQLWF